MKKVILGIILGFFLHKGLTGVYNYQWWTAELECRGDKRNTEDPFVCIYEKLGNWKYLNYVIVQPSYAWQEWSMR